MNFKELRNILFLDIETVSQVAKYSDLSKSWQDLWSRKAKNINRNAEIDSQEASELYEQKAGIYAEFAKVICITVSYLKVEKKKIVALKTKSFYGHNEYDLLLAFSSLLNDFYNNPTKHYLSGHNIKEFDVPFICRRLVVNGIKLPKLLDIRAKKPWQLNYLLDTMELWKFGDYKSFTSLNLLARILEIESPKEDIDGSQVGAVYWVQKDLDRIVKYCEKDVVTTVRVFLKLYNIDFRLKMINE